MLLLSNVWIANAQQRLLFSHITVEDGLSAGSVLSIAQDSLGFLWVGTRDGLNRYDGKRVKVFKSFYANNPLGASLNIVQLLTDKDQNLWIATNKGLYLYDQQLDSFHYFFHSPQNKNGLVHDNTFALFMDHMGVVWVGTQNGLNKITKKQSYDIEQIPLGLKKDSLGSYDVLSVFETSSGMILAGTNDGIISFDRKNTYDNNRPANRVLPGISISAITEDRNKNIWVGSVASGLFKLDKNLTLIKNYTHQNNAETGLVNNVIRKVTVDSKGRIWIGTLKGLSILDPEVEQFENYVHKSDDQKTLNFNSIYDILEDRQGNVWVGTFFGGLNVVDAFTTRFEVYKNEEKKDWIKSNVISAIVNGPGDGLWIGTEAEGLYYFDRKKQTFHSFKNDETKQSVLSANLVKALLVDHENNLWVGMHNGGVNILNSAGKRIDEFRKNSSPNSINSDNVYCLMQDSRKRIWIGNLVQGINIYDPLTKSMQTFSQVYPDKKLPGLAITCLFEDSKKNVWIGTDKGIYMLNASGNSLETFTKRAYPDDLVSDLSNCITEDEMGMIWIGTNDGLSMYNPGNKKIKTFTTSDGLAGNKVFGIVNDNYNNLWISTNNGLSRLAPSRNQFYSFDTHDGLPGNVFNYNSYFKDAQGKLYFGGFNGFIDFNPNEIEINNKPPAIVLTGLTINGASFDSINPKKSINLSTLKGIKLKYNQNFLAVDYAVLNFTKPMKNKSAYKLIGYNENWTYTADHVAVLANLPPGTYKLHIKASNNDGIWSTTPDILGITILPPPWKTWWAYTLYSIALALLACGVIFYFSSRIAMQRKLHYQRMLNEKQQELNQMKMDFFTHISHELRTPLTLIMGPAEMLKTQVPAKSTAEKLASTIQSNAERLLALTNNLLDFRKADAGHTQLKISKENIVSFTRGVFEKFSTAANEKNISYHFKNETEIIETYFDAAHMEIVISNLLSNAIKFTPSNGRITVSVDRPEQNTIEIKVCDNGIGIPKESQGKIFTHFYQADSGSIKHTGSGIGLAFSKILVELHGGTLSFRSNSVNATGEKETCFIVALKYDKKHFSNKISIAD